MDVVGIPYLPSPSTQHHSTMKISLKTSTSSSSDETSEGTISMTPTSPPSFLNDSGYHDTSLEDVDGVLEEDGGGFWGTIIRSCQLLELVNSQLQPVQPAAFCHMIQHVHEDGRLWQLNARESYVFKEIDGKPTCGMNGPTFFEKLKFCEEMMDCRGWRSNFKFLEHDEVRNDDLFHNVSFKSAGEGNLTDITTTISREQTATVQTDGDTTDGRVFVEDLQTIYKSHECIFWMQAWDADMQDCYLYSDGKSIDIRHILDVKKKEYFFKIDLYNGTYRGSAIQSLNTDDPVLPLIINVPSGDKENKKTKVIGAGRKKPSDADVMDVSLELEQQLQNETICRPDPTLFFLRTVKGASVVVLRCTEDRKRFLGVDGGELKALAPNGSYKTDKRLHFHRIFPSQLHMLKIDHEKRA